MATAIYDSLNSQIKQASLSKIAAATNIFGRGFAEKKIATILDQEPKILISKLSETEKIKQVKEIEGMADKTSKQFVQAIPKFLEFINEAKLNYKLQDKSDKSDKSNKSNKSDKNQSLKDITIVLSDFKSKTMTKSKITELIQERAGKVENQITKSTNILVVGDLSNETTKMKKAKQEKSIEIIELDSFIEKYLK